MNRNFSAIERYTALESFRRAYLAAAAGQLWNRLQGRAGGLASFEDALPRLNPARVFVGIQDIAVNQIKGSVNRSGDFDERFRPLQYHLRERWAWLHFTRQIGWDLIRVYKVGEMYYVEDGHHRVSVARMTGMTYIQAEVWEYTLKSEPSTQKKNVPQACLSTQSVCAEAMQACQALTTVTPAAR